MWVGGGGSFFSTRRLYTIGGATIVQRRCTYIFYRGGAYAHGDCLEKYTINIHASDTHRNGHRCPEQWVGGWGGERKRGHQTAFDHRPVFIPILFTQTSHDTATRAYDRYFTIIENTIPRRRTRHLNCNRTRVHIGDVPTCMHNTRADRTRNRICVARSEYE